MFELKSTSTSIQKSLLVGVYSKEQSPEEALSLLQELGELVDTLGLKTVDQVLVKSSPLHARYLVGTGKATELVDLAKNKKADVIIFDHAITPAQQRNFEALSGLAVIDREQVILDIFSRRAHTREARLQVELACMEYSLPRLTRAWGHLSRQGGSGMGAMGAGETQLETDRRLIRRRIDTLKSELKEVHLQRATRRKQRLRRPTPHAAIVGYTNAGKSSLFHGLTGTEVLIEDKLFATLDTTTRKLTLSNGQSVLLTDTVGFVRKLPHKLIESFKATLEESVTSDFLIHVLDVSNPSVTQFYETTMDVLEELGADVKRMITVFNKTDKLQDPSRIASFRRQFPDALFVSALTGKGLDELLLKMNDLLADRFTQAQFLFPQSRYDLISSLYRNGSVLKESYEDGQVRLTANLPHKMLSFYEPFRITPKNGNGSS